ncbi:AzlD domain-containing protein [Chachezhania antarctica]|uniref:AzlD domain-containing protein n=1 Tax=Chachezhania antarctica TaxID=2340860 RepID=UPI000EB05985|nr:AzlD domain-containing protein [Chachezhania antarctica]|tara:strand:+ start:3904 stop:4260 length:357 start_codon:yes stop_codon:yes gene_type:complete
MTPETAPPQVFTDLQFWIVCIGLALGSFVLRFGFLGLIGSREMPEWVLRHLRYTAVAILPALVTPLVLWPTHTGGVFSLPHFVAAVLTVVVGFLTRSVLGGIVTGGVVLYALQAMGGG